MSFSSFSSSGSGGVGEIHHHSGGGSGGARAGGSGVSHSMFPLVEKTFRVQMTDEIERDLRFLGQSRMDALTSNFEMELVKQKANFKLYELVEKEFFTMKGVTTVNASLQEVMALLRMDSTPKFREVMGEIFGALFLDGNVLYSAPPSPKRANEHLSVNWMAMQAAKPHLPHRDYVFLRYGDVFEKNADNGAPYDASGSGLYVGGSVWESIEIGNCGPLPTSQNVVRLRLRRCGIIVEETKFEDGLKISFYMSEGHPGRAVVPTVARAWMTKVVSCAPELANLLLVGALASQSLLTKKQFTKDGINCYICIKGFTMFRRKHHCRVCGDVVCSKCSEMKSLKQGGLNMEIRICQNCRNASTSSIRSSSSSGSRTHRGEKPKGSFSGYSISSHDTYDESFSTSAPSTVGYTSTSESSSESARVQGYSFQPPARAQPSTNAGATSQMILLNPPKPAVSALATPGKGSTNTKKPRIPNMEVSQSEFGVDSVSGLTSEEIAELELASTVRENTTFKYALSYTNRQEWPKAPVPLNEVARLKKVRQLHLVDPGKHFQEICDYAAAEMGCQIAAICFIGDKSGFFLSKVGLEKRELPRNVLIEAHTIMTKEPTILLDATEDIRFVHNPLVTDGQVRFYAGFPLVTSDGFIVGSFSVADPFARVALDGEKFFFLKNLAEVIIRGIEQNTANNTSVVEFSGSESDEGIQVPQTQDMNIQEAQLRMQELLKTAYSTQCQVKMQVNPLA